MQTSPGSSQFSGNKINDEEVNYDKKVLVAMNQAIKVLKEENKISPKTKKH